MKTRDIRVFSVGDEDETHMRFYEVIIFNCKITGLTEVVT